MDSAGYNAAECTGRELKDITGVKIIEGGGESFQRKRKKADKEYKKLVDKLYKQITKWRKMV